MAIQAHEAEAVIRPGGTIQLAGLPFGTGERVRVLVLGGHAVPAARHTEADIEQSRQVRESLRGMLTKYDDPFGPAVPIEDWEAMRDDRP